MAASKKSQPTPTKTFPNTCLEATRYATLKSHEYHCNGAKLHPQHGDALRLVWSVEEKHGSDNIMVTRNCFCVKLFIHPPPSKSTDSASPRHRGRDTWGYPRLGCR